MSHHDFRHKYLNSPSYCVKCHKFIWGITKLDQHALQCRLCDAAIHKGCWDDDMKASTCSGDGLVAEDKTLPHSKGRLVITVKNAVGVPRLEMTNAHQRNDCYVKIAAAGHSVKTKTIKDSSDPVWNEELDLGMVGLRDIVTLDLKADGMVFKTVLGAVTVSVADLIHRPETTYLLSQADGSMLIKPSRNTPSTLTVMMHPNYYPEDWPVPKPSPHEKLVKLKSKPFDGKPAKGDLRTNQRTLSTPAHAIGHWVRAFADSDAVTIHFDNSSSSSSSTATSASCTSSSEYITSPPTETTSIVITSDSPTVAVAVTTAPSIFTDTSETSSTTAAMTHLLAPTSAIATSAVETPTFTANSNPTASVAHSTSASATTATTATTANAVAVDHLLPLPETPLLTPVSSSTLPLSPLGTGSPVSTYSVPTSPFSTIDPDASVRPFVSTSINTPLGVNTIADAAALAATGFSAFPDNTLMITPANAMKSLQAPQAVLLSLETPLALHSPSRIAETVVGTSPSSNFSGPSSPFSTASSPLVVAASTAPSTPAADLSFHAYSSCSSSSSTSITSTLEVPRRASLLEPLSPLAPHSPTVVASSSHAHASPSSTFSGPSSPFAITPASTPGDVFHHDFPTLSPVFEHSTSLSVQTDSADQSMPIQTSVLPTPAAASFAASSSMSAAGATAAASSTQRSATTTTPVNSISTPHLRRDTAARKLVPQYPAQTAASSLLPTPSSTFSDPSSSPPDAFSSPFAACSSSSSSPSLSSLPPHLLPSGSSASSTGSSQYSPNSSFNFASPAHNLIPPPGPEERLHFKEGDEIKILDRRYSDWWWGDYEGKQGYVRAAIVEPISCFQSDRPRHVMMISRGTRGDVQPFVALARGLAEELGWMVTICTELRWKDFVKANSIVSNGSIRFRPSGGDTMARTGTPLAKWAMQNKSELMQVSMLARCEGEFFDSEPVVFYWAQEMEPDLIIYGFTLTNVAMIVSEALKIPMLGFVLQPTCLPSMQYPSVTTIHSNYIQESVGKQVAKHSFQQAMKMMMENNPITAPLNALRKKRGLQGFSGFLSETWKEIIGQNSPVVVPISPFCFGGKPPDWHPNASLTEFIFLRGGGTPQIAPSLLKFLQEAKIAREPTIVMGFSSMPVPREDIMLIAIRMIEMCVCKPRIIALMGQRDLSKEALSHSVQKKTEGYITTGKLFEAAGAPFGLLFELVDCVIMHGGLGTTAEALRAAKPTLTTGVLLMDQRFWGQRVADLGVGPPPVHISDFLEVCVSLADKALVPEEGAGQTEWQTNAFAVAAKIQGLTVDGVHENVQEIKRLAATAKPIKILAFKDKIPLCEELECCNPLPCPVHQAPMSRTAWFLKHLPTSPF